MNLLRMNYAIFIMRWVQVTLGVTSKKLHIFLTVDFHQI
jgi:hypothetical protein